MQFYVMRLQRDLLQNRSWLKCDACFYSLKATFIQIMSQKLNQKFTSPNCIVVGYSFIAL